MGTRAAGSAASPQIGHRQPTIVAVMLKPSVGQVGTCVRSSDWFTSSSSVVAA
jgi:hypothetical protein